MYCHLNLVELLKWNINKTVATDIKKRYRESEKDTENAKQKKKENNKKKR